MAAALGIAPGRLSIPYQVHSPDVVALSEPFAPEARPRCDALVTATPGLGLGVTGADCGMILFADPEARVIGAAHAGWKGALTASSRRRSRRWRSSARIADRIHAALGPCIAQASYEVGAGIRRRFRRGRWRLARGSSSPSVNDGRSMFDLHGYIAERARRAGIGRFEDLGLDTYADEARFFSYRRATHRKEADYGRLVAAIALA